MEAVMTTKMVNMEFDGKAVSVPEGMTSWMQRRP